MKHVLPKLPYSFTSLEPIIDSTTVEIHYTKHHQNYVNNLNAALEKHPELFEKTLEQLLTDLNSIPEDIRTAVKNNAGGHYNHSFYWDSMKPVDPKNTQEKLIGKFAQYENLKEQFIKTSASFFGSGWTWLVVNPATKAVEIFTTANQDCPISVGKTPILALDLWEHAYYLKYQNRRLDYITNWWGLVNWKRVEDLREKAN